MRLRAPALPLLLPLLAACGGAVDPGTRSAPKPLGGDSDPAGADGAADGAADGGADSAADGADTDLPPVDADADGATADLDCDDADPDRFPGNPERCDLVDQDCDGVADNGVITDGAGCQDPGPPTFPSTVGVLHITARTAVGDTTGTDDGVTACLSSTRCLSLNKPDWNDMEAGETDVLIAEGVGWTRAELTGLTVRVSGGTDQWRPTCFDVRLDGEPVACRDGLSLRMGSEGTETPSWTDPDGFTNLCTSCFGGAITHGPYVGATGSTQANIWFRADATRQVRLRVATSTEALAAAEPVAVRYPAASADFTQQVTVFGLQPGTTYHYELEAEGVRTGPYTFTTPPADAGPTRLRLAFGSCTRDAEQPMFGVVAALDPDLFLFIGDNHYGDTGDLGAHRQWYRWSLERPLRTEALRGRSVLATWDDHDFTGNNTDGSSPTKAEALRAFTEYQPNGSYGLDGVPGVFSQHRWGDVAIFLLDDRYYRGLDDSILGDAQEAWLMDALAASDATFKLLASGSQFTTRGTSDSWAAFPEAGARLRQALVDRGIGGVVLLSGDIHRSELRLLPGASGGYALPELTSSPMANTRSSCPTVTGELLACVNDDNSVVVVDIDTTLADPQLTAVIVDGAAAERARLEVLRSALGPR
jgi:alkaline phosphatase D